MIRAFIYTHTCRCFVSCNWIYDHNLADFNFKQSKHIGMIYVPNVKVPNVKKVISVPEIFLDIST